VDKANRPEVATSGLFSVYNAALLHIEYVAKTAALRTSLLIKNLRIALFPDLADNGLLGCSVVVGENSRKQSHFSEALSMFYSTTGIETPVNILGARLCEFSDGGTIQCLVVRVALAKSVDFALTKHLSKPLKYWRINTHGP
jgi:hypothetical protein